MKTLNYQSRTTEVADTALRLFEVFKSTEEVKEDLFLKKVFAEVEKQGNDLTTAVKRDYAFSQLEEANTARDNTIRILDRLLKGYENIPLENLKEHAKKLVVIFKKYGVKITEENYTSKSNLIMSMIEDFSAEGLKVSIEALQGIKETLVDIRAKQEAFALMRSNYENELAIQREKASATSLRKPLLELINKKIVPYLIAMNIAQPEIFKEFVAKVS